MRYLGCKLGGGSAAPTESRLRTPSALLWPTFCALALLTACSARPRTIEVSVHALSNAPSAPPIRRDFAVVCDESAIHDMITPLGKRLGLIEIVSPQAWDRLRSATAGIGKCPDLRRGIVVGVVSSAGKPIDADQWPIELSNVRLLEGAGFVTAEFAGGNYQPDGTSYVALAQVDGLHSVLLVEVNGVRFYPN